MSLVSISTLTSVRFTDSTITDRAVDRLCRGCPSLKSLALRIEDPEDDEVDIGVSDEGVRSIVKHCPGIEHLSLSGWASLTDDSMIALTALPSLKELNLYDCCNLTSVGVQSLLRSNGASLEVLVLAEYEYSSCGLCDDALLRCLGDCCPILREFSVNLTYIFDSNVTNASFTALVQGCRHLESLSIYCKLLTDAFLLQLADSCPALNKLVLHGSDYSSVGFAAVSSKCSRLCELELSDMSITDSALVIITSHCKNLRKLRLNYLPSITDLGLCVLFESCPHLVDLSLGLLSITERSMLSLVRNCIGLRSLNLSNNFYLKGKAIAVLIMLEGLETLVIDHGIYPLDDALSTLACYCNKLKTIKLKNCIQVTERGLISLITHSESLKYISMLNCYFNLTSEVERDMLRTKRPATHRLNVYIQSQHYTF